MQETAQGLEQLLEREDRDVFMLNTQDYTDVRNAFLGRLKRAYLQPTSPNEDGMKEVRACEIHD